MSCPSNCLLVIWLVGLRVAASARRPDQPEAWTRILRPFGRHWHRNGRGFIGSLQFVQFRYKIVESAISFEISHRFALDNFYNCWRVPVPKKSSLQGMSCPCAFPGFRLILETASFLLSVACWLHLAQVLFLNIDFCRKLLWLFTSWICLNYLPTLFYTISWSQRHTKKALHETPRHSKRIQNKVSCHAYPGPFMRVCSIPCVSVHLRGRG